MILAGAGISMALPIGGVFGVAVASAVFASYGHIGTPDSFTAGFRPAMGWLAAFAIVGAISALAVSAPRTSPAVTTAEQPMPASTMYGRYRNDC